MGKRMMTESELTLSYRSVVNRLRNEAKTADNGALLCQAAAIIEGFAAMHHADISEVVRLRRLLESEAEK